MRKVRNQFLKKAAQSLLFLFSAAQLSAGDSPFEGTDTIIDAKNFSAENNRQVLTGDVRISAGSLQLRTEKLIYDAQSQSAEIPLPATLDFQGSRFVLASAHFDGVEQKLVARNIRGGRDFALFEGASVVAAQDSAGISSAAFYVCEPHWSSISFTTDGLSYDSESDYVHLESSVFRIAGFPLIPLPAMSVMRFDRPPVRIWFNPGENGTAGVFARSEIYLTIWDAFEPGVVFDFYERSGLLVGPAGVYDTRDSAFPLKMHGYFRSGYINDTANRSRDIYKNEIDGARGFIEWFHKQNVERIELSASVHRWSDSEVMRNFRPRIYDKNQNPDNYFEAVLPDDYFYLSAFTRFHPNDYQNVQQRLPELRFDLQPTELGRTGIYQHLNASYAYLREDASDQYDFWDLEKRGNTANHDDAMKSSRANVYVGWTRPVKFGDFASFTPVAGVMVSHYGETLDGSRDSAFTRTLGQVGFDADVIFTGTSDYANKTWKINGLRHVLRPIFQYRYIPNPDVSQSKIPKIDREIYLSRPTVIDLAENRAIDELYDEHVFRIGLENLFQTRDKTYGSRDLVELNIYQDFRKTSRPGDTKTLSDNFIDFAFKPASWISFSVTHRMDPYDFSTNALTTGTRITDGDVWSFRVGTSHLYRSPYPESEFGEKRTRQIYGDFDFRLNSFWAAFASWRYDDIKNLMTDQIYGVRQRLGNNWEIEYSVRYRRDARDDDDFSINVGATLVTF